MKLFLSRMWEFIILTVPTLVGMLLLFLLLRETVLTGKTNNALVIGTIFSFFASIAVIGTSKYREIYLNYIVSWVKFLHEQLPIGLLLFTGIGFVIFVFMNFSNDTTAISNSAAVVLASLSALSFNWVRALEKDESEKLRNDIIFVGERFFHGAVLLLTASILKYALIGLKNLSFIQQLPELIPILDLLLGLAASGLFFLAMLDAHYGIRKIHQLLTPRRNARFDEWDRIF